MCCQCINEVGFKEVSSIELKQHQEEIELCNYWSIKISVNIYVVSNIFARLF